MTSPDQDPIAHTHDGRAVFPPPTKPRSLEEPVGVLACGQPVWPVFPGQVPPGELHPIGRLSDGELLYAPLPAGPRWLPWKRR